MVATVLSALLAAVPSGASAANDPAGPSGGLAADFASAAHEFGVPEPILLAVSYNLTRWEAHSGQRSSDGGFGPMDLISSDTIAPAKGSGRGAASPVAVSAKHTLDDAASLLDVPAAVLKSDVGQNIRGAAALLGKRARQSGVPTGAIGQWYQVVAAFAAAPTTAGANAFADDVFTTLRSGAAATTSDGQSLRIPADPTLTPDTVKTPRATAADVPAPECPTDLDCRFVPAAYDWSSADHSDPNNYGNYDPAERPSDGNKITTIVIHDTESVQTSSATPYDQAIAAFQDPADGTSSHYVIRSSDGQVTQMVPTKDIAWHAANWTTNEGSIGIEHEGIAAQGGTWYTEQMYQASAKLVRYLAAKYNIPLDRQHILGHEDVSRERTTNFGAAHWDPGPYWDWAHYMDLLGAPIKATASAASQVVTIDPRYGANQPPMTTCDSSGQNCVALPAHGANFVYLHTAPSADAPLITDPVVHPDGTAGTTRIDDWSDKAVAGRSYAMAGQQGDWTAVWYGGQKGWFYNPNCSVTVPTRGLLLSPAPGRASIPLYGRAFPEQSEYPATIPFDPVWTVGPIPWTMAAGQSYLATGVFRAENYYARFDPAAVPSNHTLVTGNTDYFQISYNHRVVYVKASDVQLLPYNS
ncbi:N-acetylmuramoyl-L-alanine amidase [Kutzneria buriramensis]|uniref:N-acetylmuramoyl-L-alanine amidase n=1 Tax=Kutzneria buriramensis TaxID=1045776 RepID=A0A3E0G4M9_9PSEU|nr:N-acetylmuramoyl-L-alanine amidase [Kutzneria buriramensis]